MVKLRLRRKGKKFHPVYDIVAVDNRARRDGAFLERLGYYDPNTEISTIKVDHQRAIYWLRCGAQPTDIVRRLLSYDGVLLRNAMELKKRDEAEISAEVEKHKEIVKARYIRRKKLRVQRAENKVKAELEAKKRAEQEAAEAAAKAAADAEAAAPAETPAEG